MSFEEKLTKNDKIIVLLWLYSYLLGEVRGTNAIFYYLKLIMTIIIIIYICFKLKFIFKVNNFAKNIVIIITSYNMINLLKMFLHPDPIRVLEVSLSNIIFFILIFICIPNYFRTKEKFENLIYLMNRGTVVFLLINIVLGMLNWSTSFTNYDNRFRIIWTFINSNRLGSICYLIISTSVYILISSHGKRKRVYSVANIIFSFIILILCDSRTAMMTMIIYITFLCIYNVIYLGKKEAKYINLKKSIIIMPFIIFILYASFNFNLDLETITSGRMTFWKVIWSEFGTLEKMIGITDNYVYNSLDYIFKYRLGREYIQIDNYYMSTIYNFGLFYLSISMYIVLLIFRRVNKHIKYLFKNNSRDINVYFCISSLIVSFVIYGIFENIFISISNIVSIVIWMIITRYATQSILYEVNKKEGKNEYC